MVKPIFIFGKKAMLESFFGFKRIDFVEKASILGLDGIPFQLVVLCDGKPLDINILKDDYSKIKAIFYPACAKFKDANLTFSLKSTNNKPIPDSAKVTIWIEAS